MSDPEPRRSVRATKGQHKALEQLDQSPPDVPKRRGKKAKKAAAEPEEPEEEVIRCICGATEQDDDQPDEPWICCDGCGAWQHNVCVGMSPFDEDLPKKYFCEQCRPEDHKETVAAIARGDRPWEARRKAYEEQKANEKKKKGPKKAGRKRRASDPKEDALKSSQKSKSSPMPEPKETREAKEPKQPKEHKEPKEAKTAGTSRKDEKEKDPKTGAGQKRKALDGAQEKETKKVRKVSESQAAPVPSYTPPDDLPAKIADHPEGRQGPTKLLLKSLLHVLENAQKNGEFVPSEGETAADCAERFALQIERAVHDSHGNQSAYNNQVRTLAFNLKKNNELCFRLLAGTLTPPALAVMQPEDLASEELQKERAVMKEKADKQAIKITEDVAPRIRRTHKGEEELIMDDTPMTNDEVPSAPVNRVAPKKAARGQPLEPVQSRAKQDLSVETQQSPSQTNFDINKVFSSVKSPTLPQGQQQHRLSIVPGPAAGPGVDPDVDRLLDDEPQSPPYSPSAETDPDIVWRGNLIMNTIATVPVTAKHIGGAKLNESIGLPYSQLIPKSLSVCGRIDEQQAVVYLCGLRYNKPIDVVVVNLEPTSEAAKADFLRIFDYFVSKNRYGVIGDRGVNNVRDTYLVPVRPGTDHPEFMLNLLDNFMPEKTTEPMLLAVFVYRNDPATLEQLQAKTGEATTTTRPQPVAQLGQPGFAPPTTTPTPPQPGFPPQSRQSISGPAFSPTTPQGPFPSLPTHSQPQTFPGAHPPNHSTPRYVAPQDPAQRAAEAMALEILGPLIMSPTMTYLLPQAQKMSRDEWEIIKSLYERDPRTQVDLPYLSRVLDEEGSKKDAARSSAGSQRRRSQPQQAAPGPAALPAPFPGSQMQKPIQPPAVQTPIPPPHHPPPVRNTPIPPPPIPHAAVTTAAPPRQTPPRQTPIPPPPIPPQATATGGAPPA